MPILLKTDQSVILYRKSISKFTHCFYEISTLYQSGSVEETDFLCQGFPQRPQKVCVLLALYLPLQGLQMDTA